MEQYFIISVIEGLELKKDTSFQLIDWTITNKREEIIDNTPNPTTFLNRVGGILSDSLSNKTVAYKFVSVPLGNMNFVLAQEAESIAGFLSLLWLNNDNSFRIQVSYLQNKSNFEVRTNIRTNLCSNAKGGYESILINSPLIDHDLYQYEPLIAFGDNEQSDNLKSISYENPIKSIIGDIYSTLSRLQRSWVLLSQARTTDFLPMKIGFYINTLECLVLTTESELAFRLQLYTANFIGENKEDKSEIIETIKKCYRVRSKFFHGEGIAKLTITDLQDLSFKLDNIVRRTLKKAVDCKDVINDNKKIESYFTSLLF